MSLLYPNWWRKNFLKVELAIALLGTLALLVWCIRYDGFQVLEKLVNNNRGQIYGTLASICGSLLGFVIATLSVVLGFSSSGRLHILKSSQYYRQLWAVFTSTIRVLGVATAAWLLALLVDRDDRPQLMVVALSLGITLLATFRLARSVWVLEKIVDILTAPSEQKQEVEIMNDSASSGLGADNSQME